MTHLVRSLKKRLVTLLTNPTKKPACSETTICRNSLSQFCQGDGVDIGYGGDPIVPHAICMDMPNRYASYGKHVQHLHGDAKNLSWFKDGALDWVYSSHVLEDFADTRAVLDEWFRVVKSGGFVVLYLPDEQTYRAHCRALGKPPNRHHIHDDFSRDFVRKCLDHRNDISIIHEQFPVGIYSFEMVLKKI